MKSSSSITIQVGPEMLERIRKVQRATPGAVPSVSSVTRKAIEIGLARLESAPADVAGSGSAGLSKEAR